MSDVKRFWELTRTVEENEEKQKVAKKVLKKAYAELVQICPHPEAVTWNAGIRGWGNWVVCKVCGVTDTARKGATPGDEYDYGYPGSMDKEFWKNTVIETVSEKESWDYRRGHSWKVIDGKVVDKL